MGQILRPLQLRGRDRETGAQPATGADDVVRSLGQRPGARASPAGQRQADAAAGSHDAPTCRRRRSTKPSPPSLDQVEAEAGVPDVVEPGLRHGQPVFAGVAAHGRRALRQQPRVARAHARQTHGQVVAQTIDRAQGDRHRASERTADGRRVAERVFRRRGRTKQKTQEQKTMMIQRANGDKTNGLTLTTII